MHILFINPPSPPSGHINRDVAAGFGALSTKGDICVPPLNLAYAASVVREAGHSVEIIDAAAEKLNIKEVINRIKSDTDLVCLNTGASSLAYDLKLVQEIKRTYNIFVCVTGPMVSTAPEMAFNCGSLVNNCQYFYSCFAQQICDNYFCSRERI